MRARWRILQATTAAGTAALALAVTSPGALAAQGSCDAHRRGPATVLRTPYVVIYHGRRHTDSAGESRTVYYTCLRPGGPRLRLGTNSPGNDEYGSNATTSNFLTSRTWVAARSSSGEADWAACTKYVSVPGCRPPTYWIRVIDASTGRVGAFFTRYQPTAVALGPYGMLAWISDEGTDPAVSLLTVRAVTLQPGTGRHLTGVPRALDSGPIDPDLLRFDGRTLHWARDSQQTL